MAFGERFARIHQVTRVLQDGHTMESIERALKAYKERLSDIEILCFHQVSRDETIFDRVNETYHTLSNYPTLLSSCPLYLTPTITSGNSALYADGAAALFICSGRSTLAFTKPPLARIAGFAEVRVELYDLGTGQIVAIRKLFREIHWNTDTVDLYEIYEPYAAQTVAVMKALKLNPFRVNISGGTLAFGHPIGATGARMVVTLIYNLYRLGLKKGIVSMYTPTGLAIALAIEAC